MLKGFLVFPADSVFGADLTEEMTRTHTEAPIVVVKCVEEIERACSSHGMFPTGFSDLTINAKLKTQTISSRENVFPWLKKSASAKFYIFVFCH